MTITRTLARKILGELYEHLIAGFVYQVGARHAMGGETEVVLMLGGGGLACVCVCLCGVCSLSARTRVCVCVCVPDGCIQMTREPRVRSEMKLGRQVADEFFKGRGGGGFECILQRGEFGHVKGSPNVCIFASRTM